MPDIEVRALDNTETTVSTETFDSFVAAFRGEVLTAESSEYDDVRSIWNAMIDKRPAIIARCTGTADVILAVNFARDHGLLTAVRGGGHNIAGSALCEGGFLIDQSALKSVHVNPKTKTAWVSPGATLGDVDHETQAFGLATSTGINSTTGIAGLTLGGGFGWLTRKYGMTIDNLISAEVVTADGQVVIASEEENADLFWGIRGGGGNFGVVTQFQFRLHEIGPEVMSGLVCFSYEDSKKVLEQYRDFVAQAPDELSVWVVTRKAPPLPFIAEEWHGKEMIALATLYTGDMDEGATLMEPLKSFATPIGEALFPHPFVGFQAAFDPLLTPGARNYWKSHDFTELSDGAIDTVIEYAGKLPSDQCEIFVAQLGGAMGRVPANAMAYPHRNTEFVLNVHGRWDDAADDDKCIGWAREFFDASAPHASGTVYVNFMTEDEEERVKAAYGPNYDRLVELKNKFDPANMFRLNHNIKPTV
jgi:FAD/FMN-containing dehydrogenase